MQEEDVIALQYDREMSRFLKICSINSYPACIQFKIVNKASAILLLSTMSIRYNYFHFEL